MRLLRSSRPLAERSELGQGEAGEDEVTAKAACWQLPQSERVR